MALDYGTTTYNMHHTNQLGTYQKTYAQQYRIMIIFFFRALKDPFLIASAFVRKSSFPKGSYGTNCGQFLSYKFFHYIFYFFHKIILIILLN